MLFSRYVLFLLLCAKSIPCPLPTTALTALLCNLSAHITVTSLKARVMSYSTLQTLIPSRKEAPDVSENERNTFLECNSQKYLQFSSVAQSCPTLCDPMNHSMPGLPVYHQLPEFTQTHVHRVGDAIQPSHPLSSPSSPAPNPSQHQGLF